jgi:cholesterol oxidase
MPSSSDTHFDAVIVGSGFGGSVMAYRLAEAGLRVCLLERGKGYPPGSFPRTPAGFAKNFWDPSEGLYGMYDVWSFRGLESLVSSGLGGGSLIYANVLLRKDEKWFVDDDPAGNYPGGYRKWPVDRAALEEHYDRVEKMMNGTPYPFGEPVYRDTPKTRAMLDAAKALGRANDWLLPRLAVTFAREGAPPAPGELIDDGSHNLHRKARVTCQLCGECDAGCNYGSKNTLDYNYLSRAVELGADVRTLSEVKRFAPRVGGGGGYTVHYVRHDPTRPRDPDAPPIELTADRLVLSAGTYGSTYLLLKNRGALPNLSDALGTRFCGNGDLLTFAFDCRDGDAPRAMEPSYGPVITSALRVGDTLDGRAESGRGFYIEDAGVPAFLSMMLELTDVGGALQRGMRFAWHQLQRAARVNDEDCELGGELAAVLGPGARSSTSLPLLGMGRDVPNGRLWLDEDGRLENDWTTDASWAYFTKVRAVMKQMADVWGAGHFQDDPLWYLRRVITVHPLGGCPMGTSPDEGVVDPYGEVFGHDGLYVADGSVLPGPAGANPSLTIAAVTDRFADRIIDRAGRRGAATTVAVPVELRT